MEILFDPVTGAVDLSASAVGYRLLADVLTAGRGRCPARSSTPGHGEVPLASVEVSTAPGPAVMVEVDGGRLRVSGDRAKLAVLAEDIRNMADAEDGGHLHIEYHPGHGYLAEGSAPLIVNSPHGGMPRR
ncbi:hypothetical protein AB0K04_04960 [Micromonospora coxensis]|uniref:Imm32 family immunity protein n=1 Tax=Micromonospora coxensis TaxID=356852 RepID=UPI003444C883